MGAIVGPLVIEAVGAEVPVVGADVAAVGAEVPVVGADVTGLAVGPEYRLDAQVSGIPNGY